MRILTTNFGPQHQLDACYRTTLLLCCSTLVLSFPLRPTQSVSSFQRHLHASSSTADLERVVEVAKDAAQQAGQIMLETSGKIEILSTKSNAKDLVTESDVRCQKLIQKLLKQEFPDAKFLGEEDVAAGSEASEAALDGFLQQNNDGILFVVDPIDGTTNFQAGLPLFCASIGVVDLKTRSILAGVIHNPVLNETSSAIQGKGAYLNGKLLLPKTTESVIPLSQSMVNVGFPVVKESTLRASSKAVSALATRVRGLRMIACASQAMAWVAHDKFQVYTSWDLNAWDVAAGIVIVREAGGSVMDFDGKPAKISSRDLIITSPSGREELGNELRDIFKSAECMEYD